MANYVDLSYYTDTYYGFTVPSTSFNFYNTKATDLINQTINIDVIPDEEIKDNVKKCTCELIDLIYNQENKKELASEKVGTYSRTFNTTKSIESDFATKRNVINRWLGDTGYLYRGV